MSHLSCLPLKDQMSEGWFELHLGFLFTYGESFLPARVLIAERGALQQLLDPSGTGRLGCRAGGRRHRGHQTPALPLSLQADGEQRALLLRDTDKVAGRFTVPLHTGQRNECCWDVLSAWTISVTPLLAIILNWRCQTTSSVRILLCLLDIFVQNSHLYPHSLKASGTVKGSCSLGLVQIPSPVDVNVSLPG